MIINLASMGFVSAATNLIITGATGAGKDIFVMHSWSRGVQAHSKGRVILRMPGYAESFPES